MSEKKSLNVIENILTEAKAYTSIELIESAVEAGKDLKHFPVQPLYLVVKDLPLDKISQTLPLMTKDQRKVCHTIDLWSKDNLDLEHFPRWVVATAECEDDKVRLEFASSSEFALFLKGKFNIWTFDVEDPLYPDHDNYFLTEDNLLLVEFDDECVYVEHVKKLISDLYTEMGVENAYAHLFKYVSEGFLTLQEEEFHFKKNYMNDFGFVDYFESLEVDNSFPSFSHIDHFITSKKRITGELQNISKEQGLHKNALMAFEKGFESIYEQLNKVTDEKRFQYLHFNFVRLINAKATLDNSLKSGSVALTRTGNRTKERMILGYAYLMDFAIKGEIKEFAADDSIFNLFEFIDVYKVGNSLISLVQKEVKKNLRQFQFEGEDETFVGSFWEDFLDNTFNEQVRYSENGRSEKAKSVSDVETYLTWKKRAELFNQSAPFISQFKLAFNKLVEEGKLSDTFYINYKIEDIDFEAIILSSLANFLLGNYAKEDSAQKMGLTVDEFKSFCSLVLTSEGEIRLDSETEAQFDEFITNFGFSEIQDFKTYLLKVIQDQLSGYDVTTLTMDDFKHVGGPIILNVL